MPAVPGSEVGREQARSVITGLGSNGVPALIAQLEVRDSHIGRLARKSESILPRRLWIMVMQLTRPLDAGERRWAAATALNLLGPAAEPAIPALTAVLHDSNSRAVDAAASALGQCGTNGLKALLGPIVSTNDRLAGVASYAFYTAGPGAAPLAGDLVEVLCLAPPGRRPQLLNAMTRIGPPMIAPLTQRLRSPDTEQREIAVTALQKLANADYASFRAITKLLDDPEAAIRQGAARVLASPVDWSRSSVIALAKALDDSESTVRTAALSSLDSLANVTDAVTNALPALNRLAQSGAAPERSAAITLAARIRALTAPPVQPSTEPTMAPKP
jgi:hypothetical protein